jgi:hypothetical protein
VLQFAVAAPDAWRSQPRQSRAQRVAVQHYWIADRLMEI